MGKISVVGSVIHAFGVYGVIHGETTAKGVNGNTFLIYKGSGETPKEFEDFELRLSFRCNATNNSGIQYRSEWLSKEEVIGCGIPA